MKFSRFFTHASAYDGLEFDKRTSRITNPDGSIVFEAKDIDIPQQYSQVATDIIAQKYFRRAGVPSRVRPVPEEGVPEWLWRSVPDEDALAELPADEQVRGEADARQVDGAQIALQHNLGLGGAAVVTMYKKS